MHVGWCYSVKSTCVFFIFRTARSVARLTSNSNDLSLPPHESWTVHVCTGRVKVSLRCGGGLPTRTVLKTMMKRSRFGPSFRRPQPSVTPLPIGLKTISRNASATRNIYLGAKVAHLFERKSSGGKFKCYWSCEILVKDSIKLKHTYRYWQRRYHKFISIYLYISIVTILIYVIYIHVDYEFYLFTLLIQLPFVRIHLTVVVWHE